MKKLNVCKALLVIMSMATLGSSCSEEWDKWDVSSLTIEGTPQDKFTYLGGEGTMMLKRKARPRKPVRTKGMILDVEGGALFRENNVIAEGNVSLGYKFNPYFSASLGFGYNGPSLKTERQEVNQEGREDIDQCFNRAHRYAPFLRAEYRILNKRLSPVIGSDLGLGITKLSAHNEDRWDDNGFSTTKTGLFARPFAGLSCRITANSYLELKGGYAVSQQMSHKFHTDQHWHSYKPAGFNGGFFTLGFKRTLKWLSK